MYGIQSYATMKQNDQLSSNLNLIKEKALSLLRVNNLPIYIAYVIIVNKNSFFMFNQQNLLEIVNVNMPTHLQAEMCSIGLTHDNYWVNT